ncbi:MAG: hypothetical protein KDK70_33190, partial [Myxococcales bacterium]|nr:hypothetical protein [Myxococcales bacterium]
MSRPRYRDIARLASTVAGRQALYRTMRAPGHHGGQQLAAVIAVSLVPAVVALASVEHWGLASLGAALAAVFQGMSIVYFGHRYPMHHVWRGLEIVHEMHTRYHHMMFDEGQTEIASLDDVDMVMFPARHALGLCAVVVPLLALPWLLGLGLDAALAHAGVAWLYYLAYELVHLAAHGPIGGPLDRVPGLGWLLRHHRRHHAWSLMHHGNFSMLIPL